MPWWEWLLVGVAGATGAPLRYLLEALISAKLAGTFPFGTLVVNVSGSFALGIVTGVAMYHGLGGASEELLGTGLIGSYTTFSTFSLETVALIEEGERRLAASNVLSSLVIGTCAAAAGLALAAV